LSVGLSLVLLLLRRRVGLLLLLRVLLRCDDDVRVFDNEIVVGTEVELESLTGLKLLRSKQ
jgi:hypothetical protein